MEINSGHERPFARLGQAELIFLARAVFHGNPPNLYRRQTLVYSGARPAPVRQRVVLQLWNRTGGGWRRLRER